MLRFQGNRYVFSLALTGASIIADSWLVFSSSTQLLRPDNISYLGILILIHENMADWYYWYSTEDVRLFFSKSRRDCDHKLTTRKFILGAILSQIEAKLNALEGFVFGEMSVIQLSPSSLNLPQDYAVCYAAVLDIAICIAGPFVGNDEHLSFNWLIICAEPWLQYCLVIDLSAQRSGLRIRIWKFDIPSCCWLRVGSTHKATHNLVLTTNNQDNGLFSWRHGTWDSQPDESRYASQIQQNRMHSDRCILTNFNKGIWSSEKHHKTFIGWCESMSRRSRCVYFKELVKATISSWTWVFVSE